MACANSRGPTAGRNAQRPADTLGNIRPGTRLSVTMAAVATRNRAPNFAAKICHARSGREPNVR